MRELSPWVAASDPKAALRLRPTIAPVRAGHVALRYRKVHFITIFSVNSMKTELYTFSKAPIVDWEGKAYLGVQE